METAQVLLLAAEQAHHAEHAFPAWWVGVLAFIVLTAAFGVVMSLAPLRDAPEAVLHHDDPADLHQDEQKAFLDYKSKKLRR